MNERKFDRIAADTLFKGQAVFPFETSDLIPEIIAGFENLLREPQSLRALWHIDRSTYECAKADREQGIDDGLIVRTGGRNTANGDVYDKKCFLHFKLGLPALLASRGVDINQHRWLRAFELLHERCLVHMLGFAQAIDSSTKHLNLYEKMSERTAMSGHTLRLLRYAKPDPQTGRCVGDAHIDRCAFTIHVADSQPGLYLLDLPHPPKLYVAEKDQGLLFPSGKAPMLDPRFKMCPHEIRDTQVNNGTQRWSIVFFGHTDTPLHHTIKESRRISIRQSVWQRENPQSHQ